MFSLVQFETLFFQFEVTEDYSPAEGSGGISLKAGDQIEVLHFEGQELWLGRTLSVQKRAGWVRVRVHIHVLCSAQNC